MTLLHDAAEAGDLDALRHLISTANLPIDSIKNHGTPLCTAVCYSQIESIKILIENGADVNARNTSGREEPILHRAAVMGNPAIIRLLVSNGANVNAVDLDKQTPLHQAVEFGPSAETVQCLIECGADLKAKNALGYTPSGYADYKGSYEALAVLKKAGRNSKNAVSLKRHTERSSSQENER